MNCSPVDSSRSKISKGGAAPSKTSETRLAGTPRPRSTSIQPVSSSSPEAGCQPVAGSPSKTRAAVARLEPTSRIPPPWSTASSAALMFLRISKGRMTPWGVSSTIPWGRVHWRHWAAVSNRNSSAWSGAAAASIRTAQRRCLGFMAYPLRDEAIPGNIRPIETPSLTLIIRSLRSGGKRSGPYGHR